MSPHKNKKAAPRATANIRLVDDSFDRMMGALSVSERGRPGGREIHVSDVR